MSLSNVLVIMAALASLSETQDASVVVIIDGSGGGNAIDVYQDSNRSLNFMDACIFTGGETCLAEHSCLYTIEEAVGDDSTCFEKIEDLKSYLEVTDVDDIFLDIPSVGMDFVAEVNICRSHGFPIGTFYIPTINGNCHLMTQTTAGETPTVSVNVDCSVLMTKLCLIKNTDLRFFTKPS